MPSVIVKNLPAAITLLSDEQLFMKLRSYNFDCGPVLPSTRAVYQRKLYSLETGLEVQGYSDYPPADDDDQEEDEDDDDDEQTIPKVVKPPQARQRTTLAERREEPSERRRDFGKPSPRKPLHPDLGDYSRIRSSDMAKRALATKKSKSAPAVAASTGRLKSLVPVLAVGVVVVAIVVFLVIKNMESEPVSSIPDKIEMNV